MMRVKALTFQRFPCCTTMKKYLWKTLDFLLFSNIFIALGALVQGLITYRLLYAEPDKDVLAILFCSTLALYNFSILLSKPKNFKVSPFRRVRWIFSHYRLNVTLMLIATFSLIPLALFLSVPALLLLSFLALISIAYSLPIFHFRGHWFGLRSVPGVKLFLIALVWSLSCVLLPIVELESAEAFTFPSWDGILLVLNEFLFVVALTIPFDIRDSLQDEQNALKTLPTMLGRKMTLLIAYGLLLVYLVLLLVLARVIGPISAVALAGSIILVGWGISRSNTNRNEYFYFLFLDGMLVGQFLILWMVGLLVQILV